MTLTLKSSTKVKIFETYKLRKTLKGEGESQPKCQNSLKLTLTLKILSEIKSCGIGGYCWRRFAFYERGASSFFVFFSTVFTPCQAIFYPQGVNLTLVENPCCNQFLNRGHSYINEQVCSHVNKH